MVILLSSAISAYDMCTISNTLFGPAMSKPKVQLSMAIRNKIAKSFPMWSEGSIIIAQFSKYKITITHNRRSFSMSSILKMLSIFSLTGLIYHRPSGENSSFQFSSPLAWPEDSDVDSEANRRLIRVQSKSRFALPYSWPNINWIVA